MNLKSTVAGKRLLSLMLTLVMMVIQVGPVAAATRGDVNADNEIGAADMAKLKALILTGAWTAEELAAGDLDGDGKLTVRDIIQLKRKITHPEEDEKNDSPYEGYTLMWADEFDGTSLNRDYWNVELHDPYWVNAELQKYVDSTDNIKVANGLLTIQPIKTVDSNGNVSYTSGRITTQDKVEFTYGRVEARLKVPTGQGFWPAFWMLSEDEWEYGYWPRCGEIDIMEILGHDTDLNYGTIHYGDPHAEGQGRYQLTDGTTFADDFHTFAVEWEPGCIRWYVDDVLYNTQTSWYSTNDDGSIVDYPAPFNHDFFIILNLAIGGNWPGSPNDSTDFSQNYQIDYVRVYQKDSYDENVSLPTSENLLKNGDFSNGTNNWEPLSVVSPGVGSFSVSNGAGKVAITNVGDQDWCIQLRSFGIPLENGKVYKLTFTASSTAARSIGVNLMSTDGNYLWYGGFNPTITSDKQTYTLTFSMSQATNYNAGLYISMGKMANENTPASTITLDDFSLVRLG